MMKKVSREFKIGFFGILMLALLYWGIKFIKGVDIFSNSYHYYAVYDNVGGLQKSSPIVIKGYKVGTVANMNFDPRKSNSIIMELAIRKKFRIPKDSEARILSNGLMGGRVMEIQLGNANEFLQEGDTIFSITSRDLLDVAGGELEFLKQQLVGVMSSITGTLDMFTLVLDENRESLSGVLANTANATAGISSIVYAEKKNLHEILSNLNTVTANLSEKSEQINNIVSNIEGFTDSLNNADIASLVSELSTTVGLLNNTISSIDNGKGSLGLLINDRQLYNELLQSSNNLSALLADIKKNPQKYVHFSIFGGGKNREQE